MRIAGAEKALVLLELRPEARMAGKLTFWKEGEIVEKHYCDVCGAETPAGHRKMVVEIEQILEGAGVEDLCCSCQEKARQIAWGDAVRAAIQRTGNTV